MQMSRNNGGDPRTTAVIVSAVRTPIGRFLGGLSPLGAPQLGAIAVRAAVERSGVRPEDIDEVILGNVVQAGNGQAPARQAAVQGGVPASVPAMTINKVCGSGLKAVMLRRSVLATPGSSSPAAWSRCPTPHTCCAGCATV
jgi:acetyl-CoA C-acetyltransferase